MWIKRAYGDDAAGRIVNGELYIKQKDRGSCYFGPELSDYIGWIIRATEEERRDLAAAGYTIPNWSLKSPECKEAQAWWIRRDGDKPKRRRVQVLGARRRLRAKSRRGKSTRRKTTPKK